jgi:predicted flap endonuclease-1-like 5' DNA nuclease
MPIDLQSLSTDTLLYMLMHSGAFVTALGAAFFIIGLLFGRATWGRFKHKARALAAEIDLQREEIATLRRKLGEQTVKPGGGPIATETIPLPVSTTHPLPAPPAPHIELPPPAPPLPPEIITDTVSIAAEPEPAAATPNPKSTRPKGPAKAKPGPLPAAIDSTPVPAESSAELPATGTAPSPLAAIIAHAPPPVPKVEKQASGTLAADTATLDVIPALPELPPAPSAPEISPEEDARLGLVFKTPPPPSKRDDLTAMKGIARVLEQRLHEFGIYTYRQIALWNEDHIREFSARLAFKDRIHREKWVDQARRLHREKHGETLPAGS